MRDRFLRRLRARDLSHHAPVAQDHDPRGQGQQLRHLARDQEDGAAVRGQAVDEGVDLRLGPDVDAAGGLVQDEDPAARGQPAGEDDLLLVAAGEARHREVDARSAHAQAGELVRHQRLLLTALHPGQAGQALEDRKRGVRASAEHEHEPLPLPVLGYQPEPEAERGRRIPHRHRGAVDGDDARGRAVEAEQRLRDLGAAGSHEAGQADHFARAHGKADAFEPAGAREPLHLEALGPRRLPEVLGGDGLEVAADHHLDERALVEAGQGPRGHVGPVAQHGHGIAEMEDLAQAMRDVQARRALGAHAGHEREELGRLVFAQAARGLVEEDHARPGAGGGRDLQELALPRREVLDGPVHVEDEPHRVQDGLGAGPQGRPVHHRAVPRQGGQAQVLGHGEVAAEGRLLVHDRDAGGARIARAGEAHGSAVEQDLPLVRHVEAGQDLPERALARPVLAAEGMARSARDREGDLAQRDHAREALGDAIELDDGRAAHRLRGHFGAAPICRYLSGTSVKPQALSCRCSARACPRWWRR